MWGQDGQPLAVTRSNRAVARFEPIQRVRLVPVHAVPGVGRWPRRPARPVLDQIQATKFGAGPSGSFYICVLPELSATASVKAVKGAHVTAAGYRALERRVKF
jgi:hypothetical protein